MKMKSLMENFRKYMEEMKDWDKVPVEELIAAVTTKIAQMGLADRINYMDDDELSDLMSSVYDKHFDKTGEGWVPYPDDVERARKNLSFPDEDEEY